MSFSQYCRLCLRTDCKLFLIEDELFKNLSELSDTLVTTNVNLPRYICTICCTQLKKAVKFKQKCIESLQYLETVSQKQMITKDVIRNAFIYQNVYTNTETLYIECIEDVNIDIKKEDRLKTEDPTNDNQFPIIACHHITSLKVTGITDHKDNTHNEELKVYETDNIAYVKVKNIDDVIIKKRKSKRVHKDDLNDKCVKDEDCSVVSNENDFDIDGIEESDDNVKIIKKRRKRKGVDNDLNNIDNIDNVKNRVEKKVKTHYSHQQVIDKFRNYNFDVIELSVEEQHRDWALRVDKAHYKLAKYSCSMCYRWFGTNKLYQKHLLVHEKSRGSHLCEVCKIRFRLRKQFAAHHAKVHKFKFVCRKCGDVFHHTHNAKCHYLKHEGMNYVCRHCGKIFTSYKSHLAHLQRAHGSERCELCYKRVTSQAAITVHNTWMHKEVFTCDTCSTVFGNKTALSRHISQAADCTGLSPCCACGANFTNHADLQDHIDATHVPKKSTNAGRKVGSRNKKKCCPCGHTKHDTPKVGSSGDLGTGNTAKYEMFENSGKDGECNCPCKREMDDESDREDRERRKEQLICEICASVFQSAPALRYHLMIHSGEKPYQCEVCSKRFRHKGNIKSHMTVHTGLRAFKCDYCEKAFKSHYAKHRHELIHSKKRPYSCPVCGKSFQTSSYVRTHVRTVHMREPWPRRARTDK